MKKLLIFLVFLACCGTTVKADSVAMTLIGLGAQTQGGYQVGLATGLANGTPVQMVCNDFGHLVTTGQSWTANVYSINDLGNARFAGQPNALAKYQQASWLFDQLAATPTATGEIQFAIWSLFTPSTPINGSALSWLNLASSQDLSKYDFSKFRIFTPTDGSAMSPQEFIAKLPGAEVPEPATLLLLGGGLAGIATLLRKRDAESDSAKNTGK